MAFIDRLVRDFRSQFPELSSEWERHFGGDQVLYGLVCILATAYVSQDYEIGDYAEPAKCEEDWIRAGGPAKFFKRFGWEPTAAQLPRLGDGWREFQYLLRHSRHARQICSNLGHVPSEEELLDDEWKKWADRLQRRFQPVLKEYLGME